MHRSCCGLSKEAFKKVQNSNDPYLCNFCFREVHKKQLEIQQQEIASLKSKIDQLESMVVPGATNSDLPELQSTQSTSAQKSYAQIVKDHPNPTTNSSPRSQNY